MFGTILSNELNKLAECGAAKKKTPMLPTDVKLKKMAQLMGVGDVPQKNTEGVQKTPEQVTPGPQQAPKPITPATLNQLFQPQKTSSFNNLGQKMASFQGDDTMNMFGVLVNMELQKLAQEANPPLVDTKKLKENLGKVGPMGKEKKKPAWNIAPVTDNM